MPEESPSIYRPEFIPVYLEIEDRFNLSDKESKLYGFIRFFLKNSPNKSFYFSNKHLGIILRAQDTTVSLALKKLSDCGLIKMTYRIKSNGGKIRFIELCSIKSPTFNRAKVGTLIEQKTIQKEISKTEKEEKPVALRDDEISEEEKSLADKTEENDSGGVLGAGINFDSTRSVSSASKKALSGMTPKEREVLTAFQKISPTTTPRTKSFTDGIRPLVNKLEKVFPGEGEARLAYAINLYLLNPKSITVLQKSPFLKTPKIFFRSFGEILLSLVTSISDATHPQAKTLSEDDRRRIGEANKKALAKLDGVDGK